MILVWSVGFLLYACSAISPKFGNIFMHRKLQLFELGQLVLCHGHTATLQEPLLELCFNGQPAQSTGHQLTDIFV